MHTQTMKALPRFLEPIKRGHSPQLAAGLASVYKMSRVPYGEDSPWLAAGSLQILGMDEEPMGIFYTDEKPAEGFSPKPSDLPTREKASLKVPKVYRTGIR
jgi:hypothetical protein